MCDRDVFERDVEFIRAFEEVGADALADGLALGDEFGGVELRDDGFEDFVADGGEHALVVVEAEGLGEGGGRLAKRMIGSRGGVIKQSEVQSLLEGIEPKTKVA